MSTDVLVRPMLYTELAAFPFQPADRDAKSMGGYWLRHAKECCDLAFAELECWPTNPAARCCGHWLWHVSDAACRVSVWLCVAMRPCGMPGNLADTQMLPVCDALHPRD